VDWRHTNSVTSLSYDAICGFLRRTENWQTVQTSLEASAGHNVIRNRYWNGGQTARKQNYEVPCKYFWSYSSTAQWPMSEVHVYV